MRGDERRRELDVETEEDRACQDYSTLLSSLLIYSSPSLSNLCLSALLSHAAEPAPLFETLDILILADRPALLRATFAREYCSRSKDVPEIRNIDNTSRRIICEKSKRNRGIADIAFSPVLLVE